METELPRKMETNLQTDQSSRKNATSTLWKASRKENHKTQETKTATSRTTTQTPSSKA